MDNCPHLVRSKALPKDGQEVAKYMERPEAFISKLWPFVFFETLSHSPLSHFPLHKRFPFYESPA